MMIPTLIRNCRSMSKKKLASGIHLPRDNPRLYTVWGGMKARCYNRKNKYYYLYGGKGITVCEEWMCFENFYNWAIQNGYDKDAEYSKCTIDRIDSNGNYCPENCRWVDWDTQARNTSANKVLTFNGKTQHITDWSNELGIPLSTISVRLKRGWSTEKALSQKRWERGDAIR